MTKFYRTVDDTKKKTMTPDWRLAYMQWEPRWNDNTGPAACIIGMQGGTYGDLIATGPMGTIYLRNDDVRTFLTQMRSFLDALEGYPDNTVPTEITPIESAPDSSWEGIK